MKTTVPHFSRGFSLVEVTLALGVAVFCLVALFGLLPIGVSNNQTSIEQTAAASIAASVVADLRATPLVSSAGSTSGSTAPSSKQFGILVPSSSTPSIYTLFLREDGSIAQATGTSATNSTTGLDADLTQNPRYRVTLVFNPPATGQLGVTTVRVLVTWPAVADPKATARLDDTNFPSKFSGSFEAVTALDRS